MSRHPMTTQSRECFSRRHLLRVGGAGLGLSLTGLLEARALAKEFTTDTISVKERISQIADALGVKGSLTFFELFAEQPGRGEIVVTFLALEMVKLALIRLVQHVNSGIIRIFYL